MTGWDETDDARRVEMAPAPDDEGWPPANGYSGFDSDPGGFYEDDEPVTAVQAAFDRATQKGKTRRPEEAR